MLPRLAATFLLPRWQYVSPIRIRNRGLPPPDGFRVSPPRPDGTRILAPRPTSKFFFSTQSPYLTAAVSPLSAPPPDFSSHCPGPPILLTEWHWTSSSSSQLPPGKYSNYSSTSLPPPCHYLQPLPEARPWACRPTESISPCRNNGYRAAGPANYLLPRESRLSRSHLKDLYCGSQAAAACKSLEG